MKLTIAVGPKTQRLFLYDVGKAIATLSLTSDIVLPSRKPLADQKAVVSQAASGNWVYSLRTMKGPHRNWSSASLVTSAIVNKNPHCYLTSDS